MTLTSPRIVVTFAVGILIGNCPCANLSALYISFPVFRLQYLTVVLGLRKIQVKKRQITNPKSGMIMTRTVMGESMIWKTNVRRDLSGHVVGRKGMKREAAKQMRMHHHLTFQDSSRN